MRRAAVGLGAGSGPDPPRSAGVCPLEWTGLRHSARSPARGRRSRRTAPANRPAANTSLGGRTFGPDPNLSLQGQVHSTPGRPSSPGTRHTLVPLRPAWYRLRRGGHCRRTVMERVDDESLIISDLLNFYSAKTLDISPWYQRRSVWSTPQKAYLINTIFERKPVPSVYIRQQIDVDNERSFKEVVDGQQRIRTIVSYRSDEFPARHPAHNKKVLNAQYSGEFKQFCLNQAAVRLPFWRSSNIFTANDIARMQEVQFVSDFVINIMQGLSIAQHSLQNTIKIMMKNFLKTEI